MLGRFAKAFILEPAGRRGDRQALRRRRRGPFVARFQGAVATDSPMPVATFRGISESDLRALYRYLRTVPRVPQKTRENHPILK